MKTFLFGYGCTLRGDYFINTGYDEAYFEVVCRVICAEVVVERLGVVAL